MMEESAYDLVPYPSYPYPNTHPQRLYTIGKLFGMQPVGTKKCKVLELGCGSGGNIIAYATMLQDSQFTGVDISGAAITQGQRDIEALGIKNITLKRISIKDINEGFGTFDYIIVHGVLSWVPEDIQDRIFQIFSRNLTKNGIAYVSYNTMPGSSQAKILRDRMLQVTKNIEEQEGKIKAVKLLLESLENEGSAASLKEEIELLERMEDAQILHDYLGEYNQPFYFHEILAKAKENKLQYLGDTAISTMFPENFLADNNIPNGNITEIESHLDILRNRRFRTSLFCHSNIKLNHSLKPESLKDFYISAEINSDEDLSKINIANTKEVTIKLGNNISFTTANPAALIGFRIIIEQKRKSIALEQLLDKTVAILNAGANSSIIEKVILEQFLRLVKAGAINIYSYPDKFVTRVSQKPVASELTRYQVLNNTWITNQKAERRDIDIFNRRLISHLDGNNNFAQILEKMLKHIEHGELDIGIEIADREQLKEIMEIMVRESLENLALNAVLVG